MNEDLVIELGDAKELTLGIDPVGLADGTVPETFEKP